MAESMKPTGWLFRFDNGTTHYESCPKIAAEIEAKLDANETVTELYTAAQLEQTRREERESCAIAAWSAGMEYHNRVLGMPTDAREVGSAGAAAIRARNEKGGS